MPCPSSRKVGGCLAAHWQVWESWRADDWVVQVLRSGYRIPFRSRPLSHVPIPLPSYNPNSIRGLALSNAVSALVEKEAIEIAPPSPGFYGRLFVTPKVTGGWRPVIDLSRLNGWVEFSSFRMETARSVLQSLRPGDWMVSLDLQDAYLQGSGSSSFSPLPEVLRGRCGVSVSSPVLRPLRCSPASWLLFRPSCIATVFVSSVTWTTS